MPSDEIGFMVRHVTDGFLQLDALVGWGPRVLRAQRVTVHTEDGDLPGVIGSAPPHTLDDGEADEPAVEDVHVDLGMDADRVAERVSVPTRYLHTVTESAHPEDVSATIDLLTAFLETETGEHDYTL